MPPFSLTPVVATLTPLKGRGRRQGRVGVILKSSRSPRIRSTKLAFISCWVLR